MEPRAKFVNATEKQLFMKIPAPLEEHFFARLLNATYWFDDAFQINSEAVGLERTSRMESFVIVHIAAGEQRAIEIAKNLGVSRQAISHIMKDFEERGWITVREDPTDRRAHVVSFSESFAKKGDMCAQIVRGIVRELEQRIGKQTVDMLRAALAADWGEPPQLNLVRTTSNAKKQSRSERLPPNRSATLGIHKSGQRGDRENALKRRGGRAVARSRP